MDKIPQFQMRHQFTAEKYNATHYQQEHAQRSKMKYGRYQLQLVTFTVHSLATTKSYGISLRITTGSHLKTNYFATLLSSTLSPLNKLINFALTQN